MSKRKPGVASTIICDGGRYYTGTKTKMARVITTDGQTLFFHLSEYCTAEYARGILLPMLVGDSRTKTKNRGK